MSVPTTINTAFMKMTIKISELKALERAKARTTCYVCYAQEEQDHRQHPGLKTILSKRLLSKTDHPSRSPLHFRSTDMKRKATP